MIGSKAKRVWLIGSVLFAMATTELGAQEPPPGFVRTPESRFDNLPDLAFDPQFVTLPNGVRLHFLDEGVGDPLLILHGEPTWAFLFRDLIDPLAEAGRVVVPDLVGFGRSDKAIHSSQYTVAAHLDWLSQLLAELDLINITLIGHDWGGLLGLVLAAERPERFARLVILNTHAWPFLGKYGPESQGGPTQAFLDFRQRAESWVDVSASGLVQGGTVSVLPPDVLAAYDAPFPDVSFKAGPLTFPLRMPITTTDPSAIRFYQAGLRLQRWGRPTFVLFSDKDPITRGSDARFRQLIVPAQNEPVITIQNAGHFLLEDAGAEIADHILDFLERRPINPKRLR